MIRKRKVKHLVGPVFLTPVLLIFLTVLMGQISSVSDNLSADAGPVVRRVNMPYLGKERPPEPIEQFFEPSIFWLGKVDPTTNYADVRMWYYDEYIEIFVNIIDRRLWHDKTPTNSELTEWDAVTFYLNLDGNVGNSPGTSSYQLVGQLNRTEPRANWQAAYRGNGISWDLSPLLFTTENGYRGSNNNDLNDTGWDLTVIIPFTSLGLSGPPPKGTVWGLGTSIHDRDNSSGSPAIPDQIWPEQMDPNQPSTWAQLHFGRSKFERPDLLPTGSLTIHQGLNGAVVTDAHVGGSFNCGSGMDKYSEWGEANYAGSTQINIQNQWDISDYPCFSKYYITFPLDGLPEPETIVSATLTMNRFGGAGGGPKRVPPDSYIHALTISEEWNEATINWNNAPLATENIAGTWVEPAWETEQRFYNWDVTTAAVKALEKGEPLRLAFYSIDGDRHSGKYFTSSDWEPNLRARPRLVVTWGESEPPGTPEPPDTPEPPVNVCDIQETECQYQFLPMVEE